MPKNAKVFTEVRDGPHKSLINSGMIWQCLDCGRWTKSSWQTLSKVECTETVKVEEVV